MRKWIILLTCIFCAALMLDAYPGLRGGAGWRWPHQLPESAAPVIALAALLTVYLIGAWWLRRMPAGVSVIWAFIASAMIAVSVTGVRGDPAFLLFTRTVSPVQTGASTVAVRFMADGQLQTTLQEWPAVMRAALDANIIHFSTSPPGQALAHYYAAQIAAGIPALTEPLAAELRPFQCHDVGVMTYTQAELAATLIGILMPVWAALAVIPLYLSARMLTGDADTAARIVQWWPLIPTIALFAPTWNILYPFLAAASFTTLLAGFRATGYQQAVGWLLAGAVMSLTTFLNFAVLPLLLLFGLFTLGYWWWVDRQAGGFARPVIAGVWFGAGLLLAWIPFYAASGHTPLDLWRVTLEKHNALVQRDYLPWLILHPYDTLLFIGWPVTGLFFWNTARRRAAIGAVDVLSFAMLLTLALVNLSGIAQGENGRILSYYAPFIVLGAGGLLATHPRGWDLPLLAAQGVMLLAMAAALPVVPLDLDPPRTGPDPTVPELSGFDLFTVNQTLTDPVNGGSLTLESYRFVADPALQAITLETHWRGGEPVIRPYQFEVIARAFNDIDGDIVTMPQHWYAQNGYYLPTCWQPDEIIRDVQVIDLPAISAPVVWTLELRLIDPRSGQSIGSALLGPIRYP